MAHDTDEPDVDDETELSEDDPLGDEIVECWCGARGAMSDMFDDAVYDEPCGGMGILYCECGGDGLCVCHNHGEVECPGCEDCRPDDEYGCYDEDYYDDRD